jgi:hypothetical protein
LGRGSKQHFVRDERNRLQLSAAPVIIVQSCGDAASIRR